MEEEGGIGGERGWKGLAHSTYGEEDLKEASGKGIRHTSI